MENIIKDFIKYGKMLFDMGLNNSHSGNLSAKFEDKILITRSGAMLFDLSPKDILAVNLENDKKDSGASVETKVHRAVYLNIPSTKAIAHAHAPYSTVLSLNLDSIIPVDDEGRYYIPEIPVLKCKETISSDEVTEKMPSLIKKYSVCVVKGHGVFGIAENLEHACQKIAVAESSSKLLFLDKQIKSAK